MIYFLKNIFCKLNKSKFKKGEKEILKPNFLYIEHRHQSFISSLIYDKINLNKNAEKENKWLQNYIFINADELISYFITFFQDTASSI